MNQRRTTTKISEFSKPEISNPIEWGANESNTRRMSDSLKKTHLRDEDKQHVYTK